MPANARSAYRFLAVFAAFAVAYSVLPLRGDRWWIGVALGALVVVATIPLTVRRLRSVVVSDRPVAAAVEGVALLLTMLIFGFATTYYAMNHDGGQLDGVDTRIDALYFTVTTLSTVGFGDLTATGQTARMLVTAQMIVDLLFVGLAVRAFATAARVRRAGGAARPQTPG